MTFTASKRLNVTILLFVTLVGLSLKPVETRDYYYTRTRRDPNHLRVSEQVKNRYVDDVKYESNINGTKYEYYKSSLSMNYDELIFETFDKIFRHRLSAFYVHQYDSEQDRQQSFDKQIVSQERCARDLLYLIDKLPKHTAASSDYSNTFDNEHLSPELTAFFDSYARQESGLLMGNTFWVGSYDQCTTRHIFELTSSSPPKTNDQSHRPNSFSSFEKNKQVISFKGRYCVASLKSPVWDSLISAKKSNERSYFKSQRQFDNYGKLFRIQTGICLPDSCDSSAIDRHPDEVKLLATHMLSSRFAEYQLNDLYCLPDETSSLRSLSGSALYFVIFFVTWVLSVLLATMADIMGLVDQLLLTTKNPKRIRKLQNAVNWFSIRANYRKFMKVSSEDEAEAKMASKSASLSPKQHDHNSPVEEKTHADSRSLKTSTNATPTSSIKVNLRFLNAFKVLVMFWIINGHIMLLMIQTAKNILNSDALLNGLMHFLIGATFGVDLFFTMTGFLTSFLIFNSGQAYRMRVSTWIYLSFHRYWRLAPLYLLTFWFSKSVMQLLGSGPLWDYGTSSITFRGLCNYESWWYPFTLTSNLHGLFDECMITSWYISCDMQFWLVSPIFIHLLAKKPTHGWLLSISTILASSKLRYDSIMNDQSARLDELIQPRADIFMRVSHDLPALYTHPHLRISAYIVGLLAGHYVYMIKSGKWLSSISRGAEQSHVEHEAMPFEDSSKMKKMMKSHQHFRKRNLVGYFGLLVFCVMSFISYLLSKHMPDAVFSNARPVAGALYAIDHLVMSLGASFVIVAMCFGQWSRLVNFLSHPTWTRLSKLNYALLLLQCEAIYYQIFRYNQVPVAGTRELINILFNLLVTLYPMSYLVTLVFEFPLANIEKLLI